jgi:hypothetical protein
LSLKFSGEVINNFIHSQLIISSSTGLSGTVKIQLRQDMTGEIFYYSAPILLQGKRQVISLQKVWNGIHSQNEKRTLAKWKQDIKFTSSLVLFFTNPNNQLIIDSIHIPYDELALKSQDYIINCAGQVANGIKPEEMTIKRFNLSENCFFSSNYLWLKQDVMHRYPESLLIPFKTKSWQPHHKHKINQSYANYWLIDSILYVTVFLAMITIGMLTHKYRQTENSSNTKRARPIRKLFLFGFNKSIKPYHLLLNYAFILVPSLVIFLILITMKLPNILAYKSMFMYFIWALLQQLILGWLLTEKLFYRITGNKVLSSLFAGFIFSILHMPSVTLMLATFIAGSFWAYAWLVFKRLIPLALSHALLAITFYEVISDRFLYSAKVFQWFWG